MRTSEQLRGWLFKLGWTDASGRAVTWFSHQRPKHDEQFIEARERKAGPTKFKKKEK